MEIGTFRGLITVLLLALFLGLWFWTWSNKRSEEYKAASQLPLEDDDQPPASSNETEQNQ